MGTRLVFDGECGFCRYSVEYARAVTVDRVEYRPYQEVASEHSGVTTQEFAASIQLFHEDQRYCGADAAFRTLALGGLGFWHGLYRYLPGFAVCSETLYRFVSTHRVGSLVLAKALFGSSLRPAQFEQTADWLYRGIMLIAFIALSSLWWQIDALIGESGILPVANFLGAVGEQLGRDGYLQFPTLLWISTTDAFLHGLCGLGLLACCIGIAGRARVAAALLVYAIYLSLFYGGQIFMGYQWDLLLIECLVLSALLAAHRTWGIWLFRLLLFRFMLLSGAVKLLSDDPTWADASALAYHFETQPLPTTFAWFAHYLPDAVLKGGVYTTFVVELVFSFFVFLPRNLRLVAGCGFVLLELLILLTGSYNFFNLLTIVMCLALLDDRLLQRLPRMRGVHPRRIGRTIVSGFGCLITVLGLLVVVDSVTRSRAPRAVLEVFQPALAVNRYGLFAIMTTQRDELVIEGSLDGSDWLAYGFPFKPGVVADHPRLATPHQPRLDWQMWFAALTTLERAPWVYGFANALLRAEPSVLALIEDPFDGAPPAFVRVVRYRYRFTTPEERAWNGDWWVRERIGLWSPEMRLRSPVIRHEPLTLD
jgi:predicted DCC family thiol-disulfide oxidoreductase YuxK